MYPYCIGREPLVKISSTKHAVSSNLDFERASAFAPSSTIRFLFFGFSSRKCEL